MSICDITKVQSVYSSLHMTAVWKDKQNLLLLQYINKQLEKLSKWK